MMEKHRKPETRRGFIKKSIMGSSLFLLPGAASVLALNRKSTPDVFLQADKLSDMGFLDVTAAPFYADPTGKVDSTKAIQDAVNFSRDNGKVCFFPGGTYLISDTISCEQRVYKLPKPKYTDGMRQSWWDIQSDRFYLLGSAKGKRPVLKLSDKAKGFDNPKKPKLAMKIWAQTRNDVPGTHDPEWGAEQPNISFGHILRGIDFDLNGHPGAIGLRHAGSQGCLLMDSTVYAEGAFAGFNNCPGQGGGTYNIAVYGGRYGLWADSNYRFPMLASCTFKGQLDASIAYVNATLPMMLVGCCFEPAGPVAIDLTKMKAFPGISLVDCSVKFNSPGSLLKQNVKQNLFLENVYIKGATQLYGGSTTLKNPNNWTLVKRYANCAENAESLINGKKTVETFYESKVLTEEPDLASLQSKHWRKLPSFEDADAVNVKDFGAKGDGKTDDSEAFKKALKKSGKVFFPRGEYLVNHTITLPPSIQIFGARGASLKVKKLITHNHIDDDTVFSFIAVTGQLVWGSGKGILSFANASPIFTENGGGRFYAYRFRDPDRKGVMFENTSQPIHLYTLNIERRTVNPQSYVKNVKGLRIYYLKCEASPVGYGVDGGPNTGNTPLGIFNSNDVKVYCACGNVATLEKRPFIDVVDSRNVLVSQVKSFKVGNFPQIRETIGDSSSEIGSDKVASLFIRD